MKCFWEKAKGKKSRMYPTRMMKIVMVSSFFLKYRSSTVNRDFRHILIRSIHQRQRKTSTGTTTLKEMKMPLKTMEAPTCLRVMMTTIDLIKSSFSFVHGIFCVLSGSPRIFAHVVSCVTQGLLVVVNLNYRLRRCADQRRGDRSNI